MEVIEDGNIMDRIPILLQRDLEYYQQNHTILSETVCCGVVGGRLDFPRNASFAAAKIVMWLEEEFAIAFKHGSGMFVSTGQEEISDSEVAKTSDPDKFVDMAIRSSDALLDHLHMLAQEALDHADLPVLTGTLGAAALLKNSLHCYLQHVDDHTSTGTHAALQACYKRYVTMSEAVAERVLDLHNRVLSLYILQDSGGRPIDGGTQAVHESGTPSVQGWWLYMNGSRKDLWNTVPPRMAQRIFAGMLNETLTILTVRYCQTTTTEYTTPLLINDIINILLCTAQLLPSICFTGSDLSGVEVSQQSRDVRDVHAKCNELFKCMAFRGAELHFIHQAFNEKLECNQRMSGTYPWFKFVSPKLFDFLDDDVTQGAHELPTKTAIALELAVLLAQPQPSWTLLVKVLMMRNCHLSRHLMSQAVRHSAARGRWARSGRWYGRPGRRPAADCGGFLCTADGFCQFIPDSNEKQEYSRTTGALTYVLASIGSKSELKSTLCYALEVSGREWAACLDKRQLWCDLRPSWLAALLSLAGSTLRFIPPVLVNALQGGASVYQTISVCIACIARSLDSLPRSLASAACVIQQTLPSHVSPVGGSVLVQMLVTITYEEIVSWADGQASKEKAACADANGAPHDMSAENMHREKHVRIADFRHATSASQSFDGGSPSSLALVIAEALCSIDEDDKHTQELEQLVSSTKRGFSLTNHYGLGDFPDFAQLFQEGDVAGSNAERTSDAAALTAQILMTPPGRDSLRVIYDHLHTHSDRIYCELGIQDRDADITLIRAPLLYIMFHIGRMPFDQYFRGEWPMPWSKLVSTAKSWSGLDGARVHVTRRPDLRSYRSQGKSSSKQLQQIYEMFKSQPCKDAIL